MSRVFFTTVDGAVTEVNCGNCKHHQANPHNGLFYCTNEVFEAEDAVDLNDLCQEWDWDKC